MGVEIPRQRDGRTVVEQRLLSNVPNDLASECGVDPEYEPVHDLRRHGQ